MNWTYLFFLAFALAMDALAVAISSGTQWKEDRFQNAFKMAFFFGFFQAFMPCLGWWMGSHLMQFVQNCDHWVAFFLLWFIGIKMACGSFQNRTPEKKINPFNLGVLFVLSIATSVDAFAVGFSLALLHTPVFLPSLVIGMVTFVLSFAGVLIGKTLSLFFKNKTELIGGIILMAIGTKILLDHLLN